ncbi:MAG TPA: PAS domain S-box protein [Longimicrobiaceae bacterium]|nr:PAS domain S-box protein [Longimicrobiaceae bacterium]
MEDRERSTDARDPQPVTAEGFFRLLVERVPDYGIIILDPRGDVLSWNAGAEKIEGYTAEEVLGRHISLFHTAEDVEQGSVQRELGVAAEEGWCETEGWRVRKDGRRFWAHVVVTALRDPGGRLVGFGKITRDLTERREAEEALRERERRFESLVTASAQIVWIADAEGMSLPGQGDWAAFTGQGAEEHGGWGWLAAIHPEDRQRAAEAWAEALETRTPFEAEFRVRRFDGEYRTFTARGVPVLDDAGVVREWVGTLTDVTERKRDQEDREFLARSTRILASSLDYEATLAETARLAVTRIADWCGVDLLEEGRVKRLAAAHADPAMDETAAQLLRFPFDPDAHGGTAEVLRTGEPLVHPEIPDALLERVGDPEQRRLLETLGMRSAIVVPLAWRGEVFGAISLVSTRPGRRYGARELELAGEFAQRAAMAIDNARLFREAVDARATSEEQAAELELQMEEIANQAAQLEESQLELETANDELSRANAELAEAEAHYRRLVETSPFGAFVIDVEGRVTEVNPAAGRILGRSVEALLGVHFAELIAHESVAAANDAFTRVVSGREHTVEVELWILRPSGERRQVNVVITAIQQRGEITGVHGVSRDVTEERQTERSLRESEARQRLLLQAVPDLIFHGNRAGVCLDVQAPEETRDLLQPPEELIGRNVREILPPEVAATILEHTGRALDSGEVQRFEYALQTPSGLQEYEARLLPVGSDEVLSLVRNVTERRRAAERERALLDEQAVRAQAEAASLAKSEFLSRMSHELRTPLNAVLGFGQLLKLDLERKEDQESVEQILKAGEHLLNLVDEVLDIARIEAGKMSLSVEPVPLGALLRESVDLVRMMAEQQEVGMKVLEGGGPERYVLADQQRLKQVLLNLLSNAVKYNRRGGTVIVDSRPEPEELVRIEVRDTGLGIPAEKLDRMFVPFERLGAEQSGVEGTGLGLALSKGLVDAMGGRIEVESTPGEGSRFSVVLPRAAEPTAEGTLRADLPAESAPVATQTVLTVLFVEDNLANVRLMERILQRRPQVRLLTAMQGSLGLHLAQQHRPDLILLDLNLPDLTGDEVLLQLRRDPALCHVPVVMISGDAIPSKVQRLLDLGAQRYMTKPFMVQELLDLLDEALRRKA